MLKNNKFKIKFIVFLNNFIFNNTIYLAFCQIFRILIIKQKNMRITKLVQKMYLVFLDQIAHLPTSK